jgi:hypothetical protein
VRAFMEEELTNMRLSAELERRAQERRRRQLEGEQRALPDAHLGEAVPLDLLKSKQDTLTAELETIRQRLTDLEADFERAEGNLKRALAFAGNCQAAYQAASPSAAAVQSHFLRPALHRRLLRGHERYGTVVRRAPGQPASAGCYRAGRRQPAGGRAESPQAARSPKRTPTDKAVGTDSPTTPYEVVGWSQRTMVELAGLEPATSWVRSRRSPN